MPEPVRITLRLLGLPLLATPVACLVAPTRPSGKGPLTIDLGRFRRS